MKSWVRGGSFIFLAEAHNYLNVEKPIDEALKSLQNRGRVSPAHGDASLHPAAEKVEEGCGGPALNNVCGRKEMVRSDGSPQPVGPEGLRKERLWREPTLD